MVAEPIHLKVLDRCALVTIEAAAGDLSSARFRSAIARHVQVALDDPTVGAIAIVGRPGGLDLGPDPEMAPAATPGARWLSTLLLGPKVVVTAASGAVAGRGLAVACLGDLVFTTPGSTFQCGPAALPSAAGYALGWTLAGRIGEARARDLMLTCRRIDAASALEMALANRTVAPDDLMTAATDLAAELAWKQPAAGQAKRWLRAALPRLADHIRDEAAAMARRRIAESPGIVANDR